MTPILPSRRQVVLAFARYYLPGYKAGGPIRSISNLVEALGDEFDFRIVTSDRDTTDREAYPDITPGAWQSVGLARVRYLPPRERRLREIARIMDDTPHDTLYLNSFFDPVFALRPLLARRLGLARMSRCVIAPRGEFSEGAMVLKRRKKKAYLLAARAFGLYRDLIWQASSKYEQTDIQREQDAVARDVRIAANLPGRAPDIASGLYRPRAEGEPLRVCFLSRISPKKNLDFALRVLCRVHVPVQFDIYGPVENVRYWNQCKAIIPKLPRNVVAEYRDECDHSDVPMTLRNYDLFFFPTRGENYGHVISEALSVGTPVLISDTTPWKELHGQGGWVFPLENEAEFVATISELAKLSSEALNACRCQARSFFMKEGAENDAIEANKELLLKAVP